MDCGCLGFRVGEGESGVTFGCDGNVLELIVVIDAQLCEDKKVIELHTLNW